jgi:GxxExxY protein
MRERGIEMMDEAFVDDVEEPNPEWNLIIGAAIAVHKELGPGHIESCYEKALAIEFRARGIAFTRQETFAVTYRGEQVGEGRIDFVVENKVIVELKRSNRSEQYTSPNPSRT